MRALLYAPGGPSLGVGHTMRSLALAEEALSRGWDVSLVGPLAGPALSQSALIRGLTVIDGGRDRLLELAVDAHVVHLDTYDSMPDLRDRGPLVSSMADAEFGLRPADLTIDTSPSAPGRAGSMRERTGGEVLVGVAFSPLRSSVRRMAGAWRGSHRPNRQVLVVMGGTDPVGLTEPVIRALAQVPDIDVTVVAGAELHVSLIHAWGRRSGSLNCVDFSNEFPAVALKHDLVVSAAGSSVWEFACMGIPVALICAADNQRDNYDTLVARDAVVGLTSGPGELNAITDRVAQAVHSAHTLRRLSDAARALSDGMGAARVVSTWESMLDHRPARSRSGALTVRPAQRTDSEMLREWRNDIATRSFSRQGDLIGRTDHERWFESVLAHPRRHLLVIEEAGQAVGTTRWDESASLPEEGRWEVSITLAPEQRGRGLGLPMLMASEEWLSDRLRGPHRLLASIHVSNVPSRRLFARAGYLPLFEPDADGYFWLSRSIVGALLR